MSRTSKRNTHPQAGAGLERKIAKYLLAGGAVLAAPAMSQAGTVLPETATNGNPVTVNLLGGASFTLSTGSNFGETYFLANYASVADLSSVAFFGSTPEAFGFNSIISAANATGNGGDLLKYNGSSFKAGNWPQDHSSAFLGYDFTASSQTYTGWAQISVDVDTAPGADSATLINYAYQAGTSIETPGGPASTPEPSSLGLFAIGGAAALGLLRRRRAAVQVN
jgi:hypothetical protein